MKKLDEWLKKPWAAYAFAVCCGVLLYMILGHLGVIKGWLLSIWQLLSPVVIGIITAYLLNPASDYFEEHWFKKIKKPSARHIAAVSLTVVCLVLVLVILLVALIPSLIQSGSKLISNWDYYIKKAQQLLASVNTFLTNKNINVDLSGVSSWVENSLSKLIDLLKNNLQSILSVLASVGSSISNVAVGIVFGVCFLIADKSLLSLLNRIRGAVLKPDRLAKHDALWKRCHTVFIRYVGCTLLDALIIGVGTLIFGLIMRLPYAALIAAVVAITNIIPTFGPMIGAAIGVFFLILGNPINALWFLIFICAWQSVDGMVIKPKLFKDSLGIPATWTLVLIILGGKLAGMLGILLSIPLAAIFVILYRQTIVPRLERRRLRLAGTADGDTPVDGVPDGDAPEPPETQN